MVTRVFGRQRETVTGGWIKLHNEKLHGKYLILSTSRMMNWGGRGRRDVDYAWWGWEMGTELIPKTKEIMPLQRKDICARIILNWT